MLQIGSTVSKSSNYFTRINDSIIRQQIISGMELNAMLVANRGNQMGDRILSGSQFKNYPSQKITTLDQVFTDRFAFEEDLPDFQWKLEKGELNVLGYLCKKANGRRLELFSRSYRLRPCYGVFNVRFNF